MALLITQFNFSISAGIGFIALFGICIQNGVIMISDIKANLKLGSPLEKATKEGVRSRIPLYQPANKLPDKESALTIKVYMFYCQPIISIYCQDI